MFPIRSGPRRGITLLEVLVVIAILSVLLGLLLSGVQKVRHAAARASCLSQLRQIGLAIHQYHDTHGSLPIGVVRPHNPFDPDLHGPPYDPYPRMTWLTRILPYVEQDTLWNATVQAFSKDPFMEYTPPHVGFGTPVKIFRCPADGRPGVRRPDYAREPTSYVGVAGTNQFKKDGLLYKDSRLKLADVLDGTSNTLLVGERPHDFSQPMFFGVWYGGTGSSDFGGTLNSVMGVRESGVLRFLNFPSPSCHDGPYSFAPGSIINPCSVFHYWSLHPGGANFLFADGSARLLPYSSSTIMPALATRAGGEVFGE